MKYKPTASFWACSASLASLLIAGITPVHASTMAYWRFETGPANTDILSSAGGPTWSADVPDSSGNGNELAVWDQGGNAGFQYRSSVPYATVPQTGQANNFSSKNTGGGPAMWSASAALQTWSPSAWTIEMSFKPENGGYRTYVGRDSQGGVTANQALAALYLQVQPDNSLAIKFGDVSGIWHEAVSSAGTISGFNFGSDPDGLLGTWYNVAAVSDGSLLSLYLDSGSGYQLVAQDNMTLSGSANTALSPGAGDGGDWDAGNFTVARGLYNGGHGDRGYGYVDEVRLTDGALTVNQFLASAVPEPSTMSLAVVGFFGLMAARRRMAAK